MTVQCGKLHMIIVLSLVLLSRKEFIIKYLKKPNVNIVNSTDKNEVVPERTRFTKGQNRPCLKN